MAIDDRLAKALIGATPGAPLAALPAGALACALAKAAASDEWAGRQVVVITASDDSAAALRDDIAFWAAGVPEPRDLVGEAAIHFPARDESPYSEIVPSRACTERVLATAFALSQGLPLGAIVVPIEAWLRKTLSKEAVVALSDIVEVGESVDRYRFLARLVAGGYSRVPVVEDAGTFAVRGAVVDCFVPFYRHPLRIELDGETVSAIRLFRADNQRTVATLDEALVHPVREVCYREGTAARATARIRELAATSDVGPRKLRAAVEAVEREIHFFECESLFPAFEERPARLVDFLPADAVVVLNDPAEIERVSRRFEEREAAAFAKRRADGELAFPPSDFYSPFSLPVGIRVEALKVEGAVDLGVEPNGDAVRAKDGSVGALADALREAVRDGWDVVLVARREAGVARLRALLGDVAGVDFRVGALSAGFRDAWRRTWVITEAEVLGRRAAQASARPRGGAAARATIAFRDLAPGDHVIHADHGVARYHGLRALDVAGASGEFLLLEFAGGDKLYLPVLRLDRLQKHVVDGEVRLDKLGGERFAETKRRVRRDLLEMAKDLVATQAAREVRPGLAFSPPDQTYREFEAGFPYSETPDQARAIDETLADMQRPRPMDRLVCGDVGFGKTEVAMRATMKAVLDGRQVAVLVPTTVLALQHEQSFRARFAQYAVRIETLSRLQSGAQTAATLRDLASGRVDVVIGTHRLLSDDVRFHSLGLLVVDEEHRFGVAHKERLKRLRAEVDVLTLTATPIPRTLQMAVSGIRDLSLITTPPEDRLAVRTAICRFEPRFVAETIRAEIARGGQVFFVHNRVQGLDKLADYLREIVPEARVGVAHGQLPERALEEAMLAFTSGDVNLLVCTTIIESGLDIPRANTMFVNRADTFGLAQLYQLRGRVGRSSERAYCYLLVPGHVLTRDAEERLRVLQSFSELGAGFAVATHDLEIRGAGNILGSEQHGAITEVGYDLYVEMLAEAIAEIAGKPFASATSCEVRHGLEAVLPRSYVEDASVRLQLYRRLASAESPDAVDAISDEIADRFGRPPEATRTLVALARAKVTLGRLGVALFEVGATNLSFALGESSPIAVERVVELVSRAGSPYRVTPNGKLERSLTRGESSDPVRAIVTAVAEVELLANR